LINITLFVELNVRTCYNIEHATEGTST